MATDNRGGKRYPKEPASYSGVGKNSKRTDSQRIKSPNVQDSTDLAVGDREKIEAGQRIRPLGRQTPPRVQPPATGAMGGGGQAAVLPDHLMSMPSTRPDEELTAGLPIGPGPGPEMLRPQPQDDREVVLDWLAAQPNAPQAIVDMQAEIRAQRMAPPSPAPMAAPTPEPEPVEEPMAEPVAEEPSPIEQVEDEELV